MGFMLLLYIDKYTAIFFFDYIIEDQFFRFFPSFALINPFVWNTL
jgi:hypothetical protein